MKVFGPARRHRGPLSGHFAPLRGLPERHSGFEWLPALARESGRIVDLGTHGDLPRWTAVLAELPEPDCFFDGATPAPVLGRAAEDAAGLRKALMDLHPWRKGPLRIGGVAVDSEWRSNMKWDRISGRLDLTGHSVLDVGCGNGYYGWRMLAAGADFVIGIDPTLVHVMQWMASRHFAGDVHNYVLPVGIGQLPQAAGGFDSVFSMGVLYHRRDPVRHLRHLARLARPGGQVVLETLILEDPVRDRLVPEGRYARMRNVRVVPGLDLLVAWAKLAGLRNIEVLEISRTTVAEQRSTEWMRFESLRECLDPRNHSLTVEGLPAPVRAALLAMAPA